MTDITPEAYQIYEYVRDYIRKRRLSPSLKEIADGCYMAQSTVIHRIALLEAKGWVVREFGVPRSIRLGEQAPDFVD